MKRVIFVLGTIPELVKSAAIIKTSECTKPPCSVAFTGQHPAERMLSAFRDMDLTAEIQILKADWATRSTSRTAEFRDELLLNVAGFDRIVVVGDTTSALLGAQAGRLAGKEVVHLEGGLRLSTVAEPEEAIRRSISALADIHIAPDESARLNLLAEGYSPESVRHSWELSRLSVGYRQGLIGLSDRPPGVPGWFATIHRHSNRARLEAVSRYLILACEILATPINLVVRNDDRLTEFYAGLARTGGVHLVDPLLPTEFLHMLAGSAGVLTDSAGVQQECAVLGIRCGVLRTEVELYRDAPLQVLLGALNREDLELLSRLRSGGSIASAAKGWFDEALRNWRAICMN